MERVFAENKQFLDKKVSEKKDMPLFENNEKYLVQKNVFISFKYLKSA